MSLLIKNQLKTTVNIGNAENLGKITLPSESEGILPAGAENSIGSRNLIYFRKAL